MSLYSTCLQSHSMRKLTPLTKKSLPTLQVSNHCRIEQNKLARIGNRRVQNNSLLLRRQSWLSRKESKVWSVPSLSCALPALAHSICSTALSHRTFKQSDISFFFHLNNQLQVWLQKREVEMDREGLRLVDSVWAGFNLCNFKPFFDRFSPWTRILGHCNGMYFTTTWESCVSENHQAIPREGKWERLQYSDIEGP